jgi:hypothetical protein
VNRKEIARRSYIKHREKRRAYAREYYAKNRDKELERHKQYVEANREHLLEYSRAYEAKPERKARKSALEQTEKIKAMRRAYRTINPRTEYHRRHEQNYHERRKELHAEKQKTDIQYRLRRTLRARLKNAIKNNWKSGSSIEQLGCSINGLRAFLEAQFEPGMSWENFGRLDKTGHTWQIDHLHPLSSFDLTNLDQLKVACHFSNLMPLWALDNRRKGTRIMSRKGVSNGL